MSFGKVRPSHQDSGRFRARAWALEHLSCYRSQEILNDAIREQARSEGRPWTRDAVAMQNDLVPAYLDAETTAAMQEWNDDFMRRYGIRIGRPEVV